MYSEYQINNKYVGRKALSNIEICNKIAEEQHRSNKVLVGNLFCLTRYSGYYGMNDTKMYYDRIDHTFAVLVLMYFGVPWSVT